MKGCPEYLECCEANILEIEQDKEVVSTKREKIVLTRRESDAASLEKPLEALVAPLRGRRP